MRDSSNKVVDTAHQRLRSLQVSRALHFATLYNKLFTFTYNRPTTILGKANATESKYFPLIKEHSDLCWYKRLHSETYLRAQFEIPEFNKTPGVFDLLNSVSEARFHRYVKYLKETYGKSVVRDSFSDRYELIAAAIKRSHEQVLYFMNMRGTQGEKPQLQYVLTSAASLSPYYLIGYSVIRQAIVHGIGDEKLSPEVIQKCQEAYEIVVSNNKTREFWNRQIGVLLDVK